MTTVKNDHNYDSHDNNEKTPWKQCNLAASRLLHDLKQDLELAWQGIACSVTAMYWQG